MARAPRSRRAPWREVQGRQFVHRSSGVVVTLYADGRVWIDAGGCERPEELRDLAELLVYLASEPR